MNESFSSIASEFDQEFSVETYNKEPTAEEALDAASLKQPSSSKEQLEGPLATAAVAAVKRTTRTHTLLVNPKQKGNPILKAVNNVPWEFDDIVPDYQMGVNVCALFLSLRYHNLNPEYIHQRLKQLGKSFELRILLVQVDIPEPHYVLKNLTRICILADMTLILAWSPDEAGKILETYKICESKPADDIKERSESSNYLQLIQALTTIKAINKTDAINLLARFKNLEGIIKASESQLIDCPGLGPRKAKKLYATLHESFCK